MNKIKRKRIWKNRRGEDMLVDFWAILVFAVIVLLFLIIFAFSKIGINNQIVENFDTKDANFMLQSFLRAPAIGCDPTNTKTVADIIAEEELKDDYSCTEKMFDEFFAIASWGSKITIEIDGYGTNDDTLKINRKIDAISKMLHSEFAIYWNLEKDAKYTAKLGSSGDTYDAETYIPSYKGRIYLKLVKSDSIDASTT